MKTLETEGTVLDDGTLTVTLRVPPDILPGDHRVTVSIEESPNPLEKTGNAKPCCPLAELNVHHWPGQAALSTFRREEMYGDDGR